MLVLDDLDRARAIGERGVDAVGRRSVLRAVEGRIERIITFTVEHDLALRLNADEALNYQSAALGSLNATRRADLAARFVAAVAPTDRWRAFVGPARRILERLFRTGRLPSFPYYVLVALAELYTGDPANISGSGSGHYYEVMVHEAARAATAHRPPRSR